MKTIYKLLTTISAAALITGCGGGGGGGGGSAGGGGSNGGGAQQQSTTPLKVQARTLVKPGDKIVDASEDAVVDIVVVGEERAVILQQGSASVAHASN